jgi:hypothetical protein
MTSPTSGGRSVDIVRSRTQTMECVCLFVWGEEATYANFVSLVISVITLILTINSYVIGPLLWSSGQSSWLQIQRSGFDSQRYKIFWEVMGLEWCLLSLMSTIKGLIRNNSSGSGVEIREYGRRDPLRLPCDTLYPPNFWGLCRQADFVRSV